MSSETDLGYSHELLCQQVWEHCFSSEISIIYGIFLQYTGHHDVFSAKLFRCDITDILLEMDRILRPEGTAIIRDTVDVLTKVQAITKRMRWESRIMDHEDGPFNPEKVLMAVKTYWTAKAEEEH